MSPEEFRAAAHQTVDWIADYLRDIRQYPVQPKVEPGALTALLPKSGPEHGEPIEAILEDFRRLIVPGILHWNHPRAFGYFSVSGSGPGILGEMLAAALNTVHMVWKTGPSATELEQVSLGWLRQWLGLPEEFFGIIHDTASTSTLHAVIAAREAAREAAASSEGGGLQEMVLYASEHAHLSVDRAALVVGVGRANIRHIAADDQFRMRPDALEAAIGADLTAGKKPFCVVPTLGTTSSSSLDPLPEIADIARRYNLWLHVDAAYAGPAAILDEYRHILKGAELADSLVVNPHKWLFTPVDLSALYTRRPEVFRRALRLDQAPAYLQGADETLRNPGATNLSDYSVALGRRFRALKLWFVLRYYGREGIAEILRGHVRMAREFAASVQADPRFELAAPVLFSLVCFRLRSSSEDNLKLLDRVNSTGRAFLSGTQLRGKFVLRLAIGNIATTDADVRETWDLIRSCAP